MMGRAKAESILIWPKKSENGSATIGVFLSDLVSEEQLQAIGKENLTPVSHGHVIALDVPVNKPGDAFLRALTLAGVIEEVVHKKLKQNFFFRRCVVATNEEARDVLKRARI